MEYSQSLKRAFLVTIGDVLTDGLLELGTTGMGVVLGSAVMGRGEVNGNALVIPVEDVIVRAEGLVASARLRSGGGDPVVTGLTVGDEGSSADIVLGFRKLGPGAVVSLGAITIPQA